MTPEFKKNNYLVIKKAIDPKVAEFAYNYLLMKRQVARTYFDDRYISPFTTEYGVWKYLNITYPFTISTGIAVTTMFRYKGIKPIFLRIFTTAHQYH